MSSCQSKLPFPQKKKASIIKSTKDKMKQILSIDKGTDESLPRSPRMTRSSSQLPQTPKSQKSNRCKTPTSKSSLQQGFTPKTPSTLLSELNINGPKTPSSLLRDLKIDSPKRKIDTALEFTSPKRKFQDGEAISSVSTHRSSRSGKSSRGVNLFAEQTKVKDNDSPSNRTRPGNGSPLKRSEDLYSPLRKLEFPKCDPTTNTSPLKRSERLANSPLKTSQIIESPLKISQERNNTSARSQPLQNSPLKMRLKSTMDIENELFGFDIHESPKNRNRFNSPLKKTETTPQKQSMTSPSASKISQERNNTSTRSQPLQNSPLKMRLKSTMDIENELFGVDIHESPKNRNRFNSPLKKTETTPLKQNMASPLASDSPRRSLRLDSLDLPKKMNNFNLEKSEVKTTHSPLKLEEDYLKPLTPIKNIILGKKSPFKAFIRDDNDLTKKSPAKLCSPRKILFQTEAKPTTEEQTIVSCELPGREAQLETIRQFLLKHVNNESAGSMYISGPPGTGKSASLNVIVKRPEIKDAFKTIYINCNSVRNAASVYETIVTELKLKPGGKSERHQLAAILKYFDTKHKSILLILDEIDALESRKQTILYTIFEWPSIKSSRLVLVGVANALDLTDRMLPRLEANVSLKPILMNFAPYSKQQILDIISQKLKKTDKFNMFNATALQLLAAKVAAVSGDIRKAIDITNHLIDLTYDNVKENGEVAGIGLKEVLGVISSVYSTSQSLNCGREEDSFPVQQKLALASFLLIKTRPNIKDVTLGKLHEVYRKVCTERNLAPLDMSEFVSACSLLDARGVLKLYGKTKNRQSKITLQWDEQDVKEALRDKHLVSTILNDTSCL